MKNFAVKVTNLTMEYRHTTERVETLKELVIRKLKKNVEYTAFRALDNISFEVGKGERIGVIGHNGAGKSTIMKLIAEVLKPTSGQIEVNGVVAPMLELGAGFDLEFSGYDNIFLNGAILGKSKAFLEENFDRIIDFADLGDFIYSPVKNYSSGMRAKLGFAVATQIEPDILIIDEVLGVGDEKFRKKSTDKMKELINSGATAIIVSHTIAQIKDLTDKTLWFDHGKIMMYDETDLVCEKYLEFMRRK
jgi:ABC-2 type transport system ATP-binding protein